MRDASLLQLMWLASPLGGFSYSECLEAAVDSGRVTTEFQACVLSLSDDLRQAFSPMLAILSAQHEIQYSRLFRS